MPRITCLSAKCDRLNRSDTNAVFSVFLVISLKILSLLYNIGYKLAARQAVLCFAKGDTYWLAGLWATAAEWLGEHEDTGSGGWNPLQRGILWLLRSHYFTSLAWGRRCPKPRKSEADNFRWAMIKLFWDLVETDRIECLLSVWFLWGAKTYFKVFCFMRVT